MNSIDIIVNDKILEERKIENKRLALYKAEQKKHAEAERIAKLKERKRI